LTFFDVKHELNAIANNANNTIFVLFFI